MVHELKIWPEYFEAVRSGVKTFEIRKHDRPFAVSDTLVLCEFIPKPDKIPMPLNPRVFLKGPGYTGRRYRVKVIYLLSGKVAPGLNPEYCILGISKYMV